MYKTVRHGENSLQYTILPQNDDFRMDSKLSSAESSCSSSTNGRKLKSERPRRRSFFAYLGGLIFICTIIVGAILIPFLVSAAFMRNNFNKFENNNNNKNHNKNTNNITDNYHQHDVVVNVANLGKQVKIIHKNGIEKITLHVNETNNNNHNNNNVMNMLALTTTTPAHIMDINHNNNDNDSTTTTTTVNKNDQLTSDMPSHINLTIVTTTITTTTIDNNIIQEPAPAQSDIQQQQQQQQVVNNNNNMPQMNALINSPHAPIASQQLVAPENVQQIQIPTITTRISKVPLLKSTAKQLFIPPVLVKSKSYYDLTQNNIDANNKNNNNNNNYNLNDHEIEKIANQSNKATEAIVVQHTNIYNNNNKWLKTHWPLDPSTYFQWTDYKAKDSVLLPVIFGIILLAIILIIIACLKRRLISVVKKRKRNVSVFKITVHLILMKT